jgi:hypothetical protein
VRIKRDRGAIALSYILKNDLFLISTEKWAKNKFALA